MQTCEDFLQSSLGALICNGIGDLLYFLCSLRTMLFYMLMFIFEDFANKMLMRPACQRWFLRCFSYDNSAAILSNILWIFYEGLMFIYPLTWDVLRYVMPCLRVKQLAHRKTEVHMKDWKFNNLLKLKQHNYKVSSYESLKN